MSGKQHSRTASRRRHVLTAIAVAAALALLVVVVVAVGKFRPVAAPTVAALDQSRKNSSKVVLAIAVPDKCEKGELLVRYDRGRHGLTVDASYRRKSVFAPKDFSCTPVLRTSGSVVRVVFTPKPVVGGKPVQINAQPDWIMDKSQPVARPVLFVDEFSPVPGSPEPRLDVRIEQDSDLG